MNKFLLALISALLPLVVNAQEEIGDFMYNLDAENKTAELVKPVNEFFWWGKSITIPNEIEFDNEVYTVSSIGDKAFSYVDMTSVIIPSSVKSIGADAFMWCKELTTVTIADEGLLTIGKRAFESCDKLLSFSIPNTVTTIDEHAFYKCKKLESIVIPQSVTKIGGYYAGNVFGYCSSLNKIVVEENNPKYDSRNNCNAIIETSSNKLITGSNATVIPATVDEIDKESFNGLMMESIIIPEGVTTIRDAFQDCKELRSVFIPSTIGQIDRPFMGCSSLANITVDENNYSYDSRNNCNAIIVKSRNCLIAGCKNTVIPDGVKELDWWAFAGSGLTSIIIPASVTEIDSHTFQNCSDLTSIVVDENNPVFDSRNNCNAIVKSSDNLLVVGCKRTVIPNTVTSIGEYAFYGKGLINISIPSSVISIGDYAFYDIALRSVVVYADTPPEIVGDFGFYDFISSLVTLYVPAGKVDTYKASSWGSSAKAICEIVENKVIKIGEGKMRTFYSEFGLDFSQVSGLKAYIATGFDKAGTLQLTQVYKVPSYTGILLVGEEGDYDVPVCFDSESYYLSMLKGTISAISHSPESYKRSFALTDGSRGFGFYEKENVFDLEANSCYLEVPDYYDFYSWEGYFDIAIGSSGMTTFWCLEPLDFTGKNIEAYITCGYDMTKGSVLLRRIYKVPSNTGILLVGDEGEYSIPTVQASGSYTNMLQCVGDPINFEEPVIVDEFCDVLSYAPSELKGVNYYFDKDNSGKSFYRIKNFKAIPAFQCYLTLPENANSDAFGLDKMGNSIEIKVFELNANDNELGDVNNDGIVDIADAVCIVNHIVGKATPVFVEAAADVNNDGTVDIADAIRVVNLIVGKINTLAR